MYIYKNEYNRQQADDWLWDTIPNSRRLKQSDMILWIDNGAKIVRETVGTYPLRLPSGFILDIKDYYFIFVAS